MLIGGVPGPKRIGLGETGRAALLRGIERVGDAVGVTLGPRGRGVLLERRHAPPWISTDGYTIARHIDLSDRLEDMGGRLIRHVGSKVTDDAGDGSTTAMVLAHAITREGLKAVTAGYNPMGVKRGIEVAMRAVVAEIEAQSEPVSAPGALERAARLAANGDAEVGRVLAAALAQVGADGVIKIEDARGIETELEVHDGMSFDRGYISNQFVTDADDMTATLENAYVLMHEKPVSSVDAIVPALRAFAKSKHSLLLIAEDVVGEALATLILNKQKAGLRIAAVKAPGFGQWRKPMLEDVAIATGGQIVTDELGNKLENLRPEMLGSARRVFITRERTTLIEGAGDRSLIDRRANELRDAAEAEKYLSFDREQLRERLARLVSGVATVRLGGATEVALKERKERANDALNAMRAAASGGVVPGGGATLLRAARAIDRLALDDADERVGARALGAALAAPARRIVANGGADGAFVAAKILASDDPDWGYDVEAGRFRNLRRAGILDPTDIVRTALVYAVSTAARAVTSEAVVAGFRNPIDEPSQVDLGPDAPA